MRDIFWINFRSLKWLASISAVRAPVWAVTTGILKVDEDPDFPLPVFDGNDVDEVRKFHSYCSGAGLSLDLWDIWGSATWP